MRPRTVLSMEQALSLSYGTLRLVQIGWRGIRLEAAAPPGGRNAGGPDHPDVPGYDPMLQALLGYMDLTGQPEGPPTLMGVPMIDLKAGDEEGQDSG